MQRAPDRIGNRIPITEHVVIPKAHDTKSFSLKPCSAFRVVLTVECVLPAVEFDNQSTVETNEVDDISSQRNLAAKLKLTETATAETPPNEAFCFRKVLA